MTKSNSALPTSQPVLVDYKQIAEWGDPSPETHKMDQIVGQRLLDGIRRPIYEETLHRCREVIASFELYAFTVV